MTATSRISSAVIIMWLSGEALGGAVVGSAMVVVTIDCASHAVPNSLNERAA